MKLALCAGSFVSDVENGKTTIYDILEIARKYHFQGIEVRDDILCDREKDLNRIREIAGTYGIQTIYAYKNRFLNIDLALMRQGCERIKERINEAKIIGADILKVSFGQVDSVNDLSYEHFALIEDTVRFAESQNVILCVENADKYLGGRPDTIKNVVKKVALPHFKVNYDCGNFAFWGQDPIDALKLLKDEVYYVHLKDVKTDVPEMTHIGNGRIDFGRVLQTLDQIEYKGFLCFEFPMEIGKLGMIEDSIRHLHGLIMA